MHVENTVVTFVLVPPIWHTVGVLVNVKTVDERVAVRIDVPVVSAVVGRPSGIEEPVEFGHDTWRDRVGRGVVAVVVEHHVSEGVVAEHHVPVVGGVGAVELAVR